MADYTGQALNPCPPASAMAGIPTPQLVIRRTGAGPNAYEIHLSWHSADQSFLSLNPEYFMFRYYGHNHWSNDDGYVDKGYRHPTHQNGVKYPGGSWYNGLDVDAAGNPQGGRDTEWAINPLEAQKTLIMTRTQMRDWFTMHNGGGSYPIPDPSTVDLRQILPAGRGGRGTKAAYFKFAIGIDSGDDTGCPKIFGPKSDILEIKAISTGGSNTLGDLVPILNTGLGR